MKHLDLLLPTPDDADTQTWAKVTALSPLRVQIDGEPSALAFTPDSLAAGLAVNDRVWVLKVTNDDPAFRGRRVVILGKAGGYLVPHTHTVVPSANGISGLSTTSGIDTCTGSSYQDMAGTGAVTSFSFTKAYSSAVSRIKVTINQTLYQTGGSFPFVQLGVHIGSTDYDLVGATLSQVGTNTQLAGFAYITGIAAGTYTIQARWKRVSGTGTLSRDPANFLCMDAIEVSV